MVSKNCIINKICCVVFLICLTRVCEGQLMCYVCDDCAQITTATPQFECNENFFNAGGATDLSTQTTTDIPKTTTTEVLTTKNNATTTTEETTVTPFNITEEETSTKVKLTAVTTEKVSETTTEMTIEATTTEVTKANSSTEAQPATPPTVRAPVTTTALPTPPNPGTLTPIDVTKTLTNGNDTHQQHVDKNQVDSFDIEQNTTKAYKPSAEFRVRQRRSTSDVTYHCYKINSTANGTMTVSRGCSRISTSESVCGKWKAQHPNEKIDICYPCSRTKCNGSSALNVSLTALVLAAVAIFMQRK